MNVSQLGAVAVHQKQDEVAQPRGDLTPEREDFRRLVEEAPEQRPVSPAEATRDSDALAEPGRTLAGASKIDPAATVGSVLYEWQATASYLSSQVSRAGKSPADAALVLPIGTAQESPPPPQAAQPSPLASLASKMPQSSTLTGQPGVRDAYVAPIAPLANGAEETSATAMRGSPASIGPDRWSDRSIRRVLHADGESTIWVRDYRLDQHAIAELVGDLVSGVIGQLPERVMLNGVEAWRRPTTFPGMNNGN